MLGMAKSVIWSSPASLLRDERELNRILVTFDKVNDNINISSWDEVVDSWIVFYRSYKTLKGVRARALLSQIFADKNLRTNLSGAKAFQDILDPSQPPEGVLKIMKQVQNYMKSHINAWTKSINTELTRIQRIRDKQAQVTGMVGIGLVTLGQIFSQYISVRYFSSDYADNADEA